MAQYAIAFDLSTKTMRADGMTKSEITSVYNTEIPQALASCGFTVHAQGSLYHTEADQNPITAIMQLQSTLTGKAPKFCKYVKRVHVFRMEEWSDVTALIANREADAVVDPEEEAEEDELTAESA